MFRIVGLFHLLGCLLNKSEKSEMIQISPKRFFGIPAFYSEVYLFTDSLLLKKTYLINQTEPLNIQYKQFFKT
jgi:hypothetical protein